MTATTTYGPATTELWTGLGDRGITPDNLRADKASDNEALSEAAGQLLRIMRKVNEAEKDMQREARGAARHAEQVVRGSTSIDVSMLAASAQRAQEAHTKIAELSEHVHAFGYLVKLVRQAQS